MMNRRNFAGVSGVIIDVCREDGVWLDNQELNRIVQFLETGGMDKARAVEAREREHSEHMRARPVPSLPLEVVKTAPQSSGEFLGAGGTAASILSRVLTEVARAFFTGV